MSRCYDKFSHFLYLIDIFHASFRFRDRKIFKFFIHAKYEAFSDSTFFFLEKLATLFDKLSNWPIILEKIYYFYHFLQKIDNFCGNLTKISHFFCKKIFQVFEEIIKFFLKFLDNCFTRNCLQIVFVLFNFPRKKGVLRSWPSFSLKIMQMLNLASA